MLNPNLKPCPFCGNKLAPTLMDSEELGREIGNEQCKNIHWSICCDFNDGGCGAEGGFRVNQEAAIEVWNQRI